MSQIHLNIGRPNHVCRCCLEKLFLGLAIPPFWSVGCTGEHLSSHNSGAAQSAERHAGSRFELKSKLGHHECGDALTLGMSELDSLRVRHDQDDDARSASLSALRKCRRQEWALMLSIIAGMLLKVWAPPNERRRVGGVRLSSLPAAMALRGRRAP